MVKAIQPSWIPREGCFKCIVSPFSLNGGSLQPYHVGSVLYISFTDKRKVRDTKVYKFVLLLCELSQLLDRSHIKMSREV